MSLSKASLRKFQQQNTNRECGNDVKFTCDSSESSDSGTKHLPPQLQYASRTRKRAASPTLDGPFLPKRRRSRDLSGSDAVAGEESTIATWLESSDSEAAMRNTHAKRPRLPLSERDRIRRPRTERLSKRSGLPKPTSVKDGKHYKNRSEGSKHSNIGLRGSWEDPIILEQDNEASGDGTGQSAFLKEKRKKWSRKAANIDYEKVTQLAKDYAQAREWQDDDGSSRIALISTRECDVCEESFPISEMPLLDSCLHLPQTCAPCFAQWIAAQLQGSIWQEAKCPQSKCEVALTYHDIQQHASSEVFQQYDAYIARAVLNEDPDFRWCRSCEYGQIHGSGDEGNIFTCANCGHKVCTIHEKIWHEGETCDEYEERSSREEKKKQKAQEKASLKTLGKMSKKCPGPKCAYSIEKTDGCDHMTCSKCRWEFCWICLCDYKEVRSRGNTAHAEDCKYHTARLA